MIVEYPTKYSDRHGSIKTRFFNDGKLLSISIRGIEFQGPIFDMLEPIERSSSEILKTFTFRNKCLCDCKFECDIPILIANDTETISAELHMNLILGKPAPISGLDFMKLNLDLYYKNTKILSTGKFEGHFESELLNIQKKLPPEFYFKSCFGCAYSDYSPVGSDIFGTMICFRNNKQEYLSIRSNDDMTKDNMFDVIENTIKNTKLEGVQETYLCNEFIKRVPGTGYRG